MISHIGRFISNVNKFDFRESNPNNYGLNQTISVQTDSVKVESVSVMDTGCPLWTTSSDLGNGCDTMTQLLLLV